MSNDMKFSRIERFLASDKGKRFMNFGYSWGAAIVILGAMFKIIHLDGANEMLAVGMTTEVIIFLILGFDRSGGRGDFGEDENKDVVQQPQQVIIQGGGGMPAGSNAQVAATAGGATPAAASVAALGGAPVSGGGVYGGGYVGGSLIPPGLNVSDEDISNLSESIQKLSVAAQQFTKMAEHVDAFGETASTLATMSSTLMNSYKGISDNSEGIVNNSIDYINQMESINRNLSGLNTIYEIQLKSLASQIEAIDKVNTSLNRIKEMYESSTGNTGRFREETEKMSQQLAALNSVYGRILNAMSMNMYGGGNNRY